MMKKSFYVFLLPLLLLSCSKEEDDSLEKITDTIVGRYVCRSATIQGRLLDINGDGKVGDDMMTEFEGFELAYQRITEEPVRIFPVKEYETDESFHIEIPKQRVDYDKRSGKYIIRGMYIGDSMYIGFEYSVDRSGKINAAPHNEGNGDDLGGEYDDMIYLIDYQGNSAKEIAFDQAGGFEAVVDCTCYDFATDEMVTVPVRFVYERVSYSLD